MKDAYREGFSARLAGAEIEDNPYTRATGDWTLWAEGWMDQDHHLYERDNALDSIGWFG